MNRFVRRDPDTHVPRSSVDVEVRDCPICRAENAVIIPTEFCAPGGEAALVHDRSIASTRQVLCRHCRTSLMVVLVLAAKKVS